MCSAQVAGSRAWGPGEGVLQGLTALLRLIEPTLPPPRPRVHVPTACAQQLGSRVHQKIPSHRGSLPGRSPRQAPLSLHAILGMQAPGSAGTLVTLPGPRGEGTVSVFAGQETKARGQHVFPENGGPWGGAGVCATVGPGIFLPPTACPDTCPASGSPGSASLALISQGPRASASVTEGGGLDAEQLPTAGSWGGLSAAGTGLQRGKWSREPDH